MTKKSAPRKTGKGRIYLAGAATAIFMLATSVSFADSLVAQIPETLDINIQVSNPELGVGKDKKAVTGFSHRLHAQKYLIGQSAYAANAYTDEFTCAACHAGAKEVKDIVAVKKSERLAAAIEAEGGVKKYKNMMHATCLDCHKKMKKAKNTTGPTSCKGCHGK